MTARRNNAANNAELVNRWDDVLRGVGLRATFPRRLVVESLSRATTPLTHAELSDLSEPQGVDKATVFRILSKLVDVGLVRRTELGDHVWRYEWLGNSPKAEHTHPHFVCDDCGTVSCLSSEDTPKSVASPQVGSVSEVLYRGRCRVCFDKPAPKTARGK